MVVEGQHAVLWQSQAGPGAVVGVIAVGHHAVEAVVAAAQLDHHQDPVAGNSRGVGRRSRRGAKEEPGRHAQGREQGGRLEKGPSGNPNVHGL